MSEVRRGCLVLADISGYTSYLGGVELEHSHDVLADLLGVVAGQLAAVGPLAKLEGDAVFVCDRDGATNGEQLLAALDAAYASFVRRRRTIALRSTCACEACARVPSLDLKFVVHHGEFVEHVVAGSEELVGADVILVHRLLKNTFSKQREVRAYALLTAACTRALGLDPVALELTRHVESYEGVGEIETWGTDMGACLLAEQESNPTVVSEQDAFLEVSSSFPAPAAAVWEALLDPACQLRWREGATAVETVSPRGARGVGSRTHCVHGPQTFDQEIVDWRPFDCYTYSEQGPFGSFLWTFALEPDGRETRLHVRVRLGDGRRQRLVMLIGRSRMRGIIERNLKTLASELAAASA